MNNPYGGILDSSRTDPRKGNTFHSSLISSDFIQDRIPEVAPILSSTNVGIDSRSYENLNIYKEDVDRIDILSDVQNPF